MAEVILETDTYDVHIDPPQTLDVEVHATVEQLLPLIDVNQNLAAANRHLVEQVLPTLRGGLQTKEVAPADIEQVVTPDDGYLGLQRVKVAPYEREVQVVNRRMNDLDDSILYRAEEVAEQYYRSDYAVAVAFEFYKIDATTKLLNADAYLTSDGDFYDSTNTHTWHDDNDKHANRFIVCYFKVGENKSNFDISYFTAYRIAIKGDLGSLIINKEIGLNEIIVFDDSSVLDICCAINTTSSYLRNIRINNILNHTSGYLIGNNDKNYKYVEFGIRRIASDLFQRPEYILSLNLPDLTECTFPIYNRTITKLTEIYIPKLVRATFSMANSSVLTKLDAPKLCYIGFVDDDGGEAFGAFVNSPVLKEFSAPLLEKVWGSYSSNGVIGASALEELNLPKLLTISEEGRYSNYHGYVIANSPNLKRLILPKFNLWYRASIFVNCPALEYVYVPSCTIIQNESYNGNSTSNMPNLKTYIIGKLNYDNINSGLSYNAFLDCPRLIHLEAVMTQDINVQLPKWQPTEALTNNTDLIEDTNRCATNREQFFVNFVEYILHKLQDRTGTSKLTLTLSATVYNAIFSDESGFAYNGQPIGDYVTSYIAGINWSVAKAS